MTTTGVSRPGLIGAVLAGAATGGRAFTGLAALAMTARPDAAQAPDAVLIRPEVRGLIGVLAVGELLADKLPAAPSRLAPIGLSGRVAIGALCGAIVARRRLEPVLTEWPGQPADEFEPAATVALAVGGALVATAAAWCGTRWRARAASLFGRDWVGALIEDTAVVALAAAAARSASREDPAG